MSFYSRYRGRTAGRVSHFLYYYCPGSRAYDLGIFTGNASITLHGELFASWTWENTFGMYDVPAFTFHKDRDGYYAQEQIRKREEAIEMGCSFSIPEKEEIVSAKVMSVLHRDAYHSANLACQIIHESSSEFFIAKHKLYVQANDWIYQFSDCGWILWTKGTIK